MVKRIPSGLEKMWVFVCGEWLSLHNAPYKPGMELFAKKYSKTGRKLSWICLINWIIVAGIVFIAFCSQGFDLKQ